MRGRSNSIYFMKRIKPVSAFTAPPSMSITPASAMIDRWGAGRSVQVVISLSTEPSQNTVVAISLSDPSVTSSASQLTFGPGLPVSATLTLTGTTYGPNNVTMMVTPSNPAIMPQALLITRPSFGLPVQSGLEFWFKSDGGALKSNGTAASLNNDLIAQLFDMSANARSMTQANSTFQAKYQLNQQNGLPGVVFDGVDDLLEFSGTLSLNDMSIFWVGRILENPTASSAFLHGPFANSGPNNYANGLFWFQGGDILQAAVGTFNQNVPYSLQIYRNNANWQVVVNGQAKTANGNSTVAQLKGVGKSFSDFSNMVIHEVVIFSRALSASEQSQVLNYLGRWGI